MKKLLVLVMAMLFVAAGCSGTNEANGKEDTNSSDNTNKNKDETNEEVNLEQLLQQLEMTADVQADADKVDFNFQMKNTGEEAVELTFPSGQQYEVIVKNAEGEEVYRYSKGKAFTEALVNKEIKPGEALSWKTSWNYKQDDERVEAGTYTAEITLLPAKINKQTIDAQPFQLTQNFEVPSGEQTFRNVKVTENDDGNYTVTGEARAFEASFAYNVEDGHNLLVPEQNVTASTGAPNWGTFEFDVNIAKDKLPSNGTLTLTLYTKSAKDGSVENVKFVKLDSFQPE